MLTRAACIRLLSQLTIAAIVIASVTPVPAREVVIPWLQGTVYIDGRPTDKMIRVCIEAENSALIATTYTGDLGKFVFRDTVVVFEETYFLVIKDLDYKEVRYRLDRSFFYQDSALSSIIHSGGSVNLDLERIPSEKGTKKADTKSIDVRQLKAEISDEARKEYKMAQADLASGNHKDGMNHLKKAVELSPDYYDALARLGLEYMKAGQPKEAQGVLERAQSLNPNDPVPLTNLGILRFQEGGNLESGGAENAAAAEICYRNAAELFEKALLLSPLAPRTNLYLGISYYKLRSYDKAESLLINALALNGRMHEARLTLINIYNRQRRYEDVLKQIDEYLQANPNSPERSQLEELRSRVQGVLAKQ